MKKNIGIVIVYLFLVLPAKGQSVRQVQDMLSHYSQRIQTLRVSNDYENRDDSLKAINKSLVNYLKTVGEKNPATLKARFNPNEGIKILTSDDGLFRVYGWDVGNIGKAKSFDAVFQYQSGKNTRTFVMNDASEISDTEGVVCSGEYYGELYTIHTKDSGNVYLVFGYSSYASGLGGPSLTAYKLRSGKLISAYPFFNTTKETVGEISFTYDLEVAGNEHAYMPVIEISKDKQTIYIPVINKDEKVTTKDLVYKFDGNRFVYDKSAR